MAYSRKYGKRRYSKKRSTRPKRTFKKRINRRKRYLPRNDQFKKHTARLCYHEVITLDCGPSGSVEFAFAANDAGDPNHTGTGHQPMGFDQLCPGKYDHFTVIGSICKVRFLNLNNNALAIPPLVGLRVTDVTGVTAGRDLSYLREMGIAMKPMGTQMSTIMNDSNNVLTAKFSAKKFFGMANIVGEASYRGDAATSPAELAFFSICAVSPDAIVDPSSIKLEVMIEYIVVFTEPRRLPQS